MITTTLLDWYAAQLVPQPALFYSPVGLNLAKATISAK
jgi:hypothetical protein